MVLGRDEVLQHPKRFQKHDAVLKGMAELEFLCLNSQENFEDNKQFLRTRLEQEGNPAVRRMLEQDLTQLDRMQVQMATAREFLVVIRLRNEKESEVFPYLNRIEKTLREQGFSTKRAGKEDIKRLLAIYFEQNVTTEKYEEYDGDRWVILMIKCFPVYTERKT